MTIKKLKFSSETVGRQVSYEWTTCPSRKIVDKKELQKQINEGLAEYNAQFKRR